MVPHRVGNGVDEKRPILYPTTPHRHRQRRRDRPCLAANVERSIIIIIVATAAAGAAITNHPVLDDREVDPIVRSRCCSTRGQRSSPEMVTSSAPNDPIYIQKSGAAYVPKWKSCCYPPRGITLFFFCTMELVRFTLALWVSVVSSCKNKGNLYNSPLPLPPFPCSCCCCCCCRRRRSRNCS